MERQQSSLLQLLGRSDCEGLALGHHVHVARLRRHRRQLHDGLDDGHALVVGDDAPDRMIVVPV